jgi:hypothetical protein
MSSMKSVAAAAAITLASGRLELTAAQASSRKHSLKLVKETKSGGIYEIAFPVQFKAGEKFGYDGEVPKSMLDVFVDPREVAARAREKAEAEQVERRAIAVEARADVCTRIRDAVAKIEMPEELRGSIVAAVDAAEIA